MDRNRWILAAGVLVVAVGVGVWATFFRGPSEKCRPVIELLDFNRSQAALISSKSDDAPATVPTVAEDAVYQQWADGLAARAQKVTDPALAAQALQVADLASQFAAGLPRLRTAAHERAPGSPASPVVYEMALLNDRITSRLGQLAKACS